MVARAVEKRQIDVRIYGGVTVAGEVLGARKHAFGLQPAQERAAHFRDVLRIAAEAATRRDGAFGIGGQIEHGGKIQVHSGATQLTGHGAGHTLDKTAIAQAA